MASNDDRSKEVASLINDTVPVQVLWIARYDYNPGWRLTLHDHNHYQIIYICDGAGVFFLGENTHTVRPGMLYFIGRNCPHGLHTNKSSSLKTLDIKFMVTNNSEFHDKLGMLNARAIHCTSDPRTLLERIRNEGENQNDYYHEMSNMYLMQLLVNLLREYPSKTNTDTHPDHFSPNTDPQLQKAITFIHEHYSQELSLQQIAKAAGYNQRHLISRFNESFGISPIRFLYSIRAQNAQELIRYSDYELKQIAIMTGFKSVHHFSRVFHQTTGYPPGAWRDMERKGIRKDVIFTPQFHNRDFVTKKQ